MRLICPSCGACHSSEAWSNDDQARQCFKLIGDLPHVVAARCLPYLSLFRPSANRGLAWSKAIRLLSELQGFMCDQDIQWEGKVPRPNSAMAWAQAMERITDRPPKSLPLKSHGYLRSIAYEIADEMDKAAESRKRLQERTWSPARQPAAEAQHPVHVVYPETPERFTIPPEKLRAIREKNMKRGKVPA